MYIAVFFELLWIDIIPTGTFIPPNAIFCVLATITLVEIFRLEYASQIFPVMAATIPIAFLCSRLEGAQRNAQNKNYNIILQRSRKNTVDYKPQAMIMKSILQMILIYLAAGIAGIYSLFMLLDLIYLYLPTNNFFSWYLLLILSSVSALAALRIKKAYFSLILGMLLVSGFFFWEMIWI